MEASTGVVDLHRVPTRRYDLQELKARLVQEKEASAQPASAGDQLWYLAVQSRKAGPMTRAGLVGVKERGLLSPSSLVWREGWPVWAAAEAVQELRPLLGLSPELRPLLGLSPELELAPPLPSDAVDGDRMQRLQRPAAPELEASAPAEAPLAGHAMSTPAAAGATGASQVHP
jgi:hypothetical protein